MNVIEQLEELGFEKIRIYDDLPGEQYYDAVYLGEEVEVLVKKGKIYWRYLGIVKEPDEVEWFEVGKVKS